ncbi:MAG: OmpA family protein [Endomicrobiia bacterium]
MKKKFRSQKLEIRDQMNILFLTLCFMFFSTFLSAKSYEFEFLNIPSGVRATGLGGNFVSMEDSVEGLFYNPAIAGTIPFGEMMFAHHLYYNGSSDSQVAINIPFNKFGFGFTGKYFTTPDILQIENYVSKGNYSLKSFYGGVQVGFRVVEWFGLGFGSKYVNETMLTRLKNVMLYDTGFVLKTKNNVFSFCGSIENYNNDANKYLIQYLYNLGFTIRLDLPQQSSKINFVANTSIDTKTSQQRYSFGIEHWGSDVLGLRIGYVYDIEKMNSGAYVPITFFRAGLSLRIKSFGIDYAYSPSQPLENTHNIGLNYRFKEFKKMQEIVKQARLDVEPYYFSPNSDGYKDNIFFIHNATSTKGFVEWKFEIRDNFSNQIVDIITYSSTTKKVDSLYVYNARSQLTDSILRDGVYNVKFTLTDTFDKQKIIYKTVEKDFVVDTVGPKIFINISTETFSPDGDGVDDELVAELKIDDELSPIETINVKIYTLNDKQIKNYNLNLSTQMAKSIITTIVWDGRDDLYNNIVPNGEYKIRVSVKDFSGNKNFVEEKFFVKIEKKQKIEVQEKIIYIKGAKVSIDDRGIVVTYSTDDLFIKGTTEIDTKMYDSLLSLSEAIKSQYATNKIIIEGHTDSVGDENVNLQKSSSYAWAVYSSLVKNFGVEAKNLEVKGFGKSKPIASNKTKIGRAQNRRIEIVILKK